MKTEFDYTAIEDVYLPNLVSTETNYEIGFWGQRHKEYLKENHRVIYYNLLTQGKLNSFLYKIDIKASNMNCLLNNLLKVKMLPNNSKQKIKCFGYSK